MSDLAEYQRRIMALEGRLELLERRFKALGESAEINCSMLTITCSGTFRVTTDTLEINAKQILHVVEKTASLSAKEGVEITSTGAITASGRTVNLQGQTEVNLKSFGNVVMKGSKVLQN